MVNFQLMQNSETHLDLVYHLLGAWDMSVKMHRDLPREAGDAVINRANERRKRLRRTIPEYNPPSRQAIIQWWSDHGEMLQGYERGLALHNLLRHLDNCYGLLDPTWAQFEDDWLVVGRRWWDARETRIPRTNGGISPALSKHQFPPGRLHFPHLRRVTSPSLEFRDKQALSRLRFRDQSGGSDGSIRIGLISLSGKAQTYFRPSQVIEPGLYGFVADDVRCNPTATGSICEDYLDELRSVTNMAIREQFDVLCLPELCVCHHGREAMRKALEEANRMLLVVPGSYHQEAPTRGPVKIWENSAPIWETNSGRVEEISRAVKIEPFGFSVPAGEANADPTIAEAVRAASANGCDQLSEDVVRGSGATLIRSPIGLWGVMICRDALYPVDALLDAMSLLADHVIVISMDEHGAQSFRSFGANQNRFHLSAVYYVNAAQRLRNTERDELHAAWWLPSRNIKEGHWVEIVTNPEATETHAGKAPQSLRRNSTGDGVYVLNFTHCGQVR